MWFTRSRTAHDAHGVDLSRSAGCTFASTLAVLAKARSRMSALIASPLSDPRSRVECYWRGLLGVPGLAGLLLGRFLLVLGHPLLLERAARLLPLAGRLRFLS